MKNAKLITIISVVVAVALLACCFIFNFKKGADVGKAWEMRVELNEEFKIADVEKIMKDAGALDCVVTAQAHDHDGELHTGTIADIVYAADDAQAVFAKAEELLGEKYFLKYEAEAYQLTDSVTRASVLEGWPVAIVLAVLLVYMFFRFGLKYALAALIAVVEVFAVNAGVVSVAGIRFTSFTSGVFMGVCALAFFFALFFAVAVKDNGKKSENADEAFSVSVKQLIKLAVLVCAVAAIGLCVALIFGGALLKNMAITALIGVAANAAVAVFVIPAAASFVKAK